ncbi:MAG: DUF2846 domain-containing protein [Blastocatellia bacterium]
MKTLLISLLLLLASFASSTNAQTSEEKKQADAQDSSAAEKKSSEPAQDAKGTVYVYRYKQYAGSGLEPSVYCNDVELARMDNGRYFTVKLSPGKHTFRSNDKQAGIEMDLKSGEDYYIRVEIVAGFMKGHGRLVLTQKEQGAYEIKKLKPLDADKVKDKTRVSIEEKPIK